MNLTNFRNEVRALLQARQAPARARSSAPPSVAEQLERSIKQLIVDGEIAPGCRLLEIELAERFSVSRAPVRDALRMLDKQGFVELTPRRGAVVYQPTPQDVRNLYEVRAELFALAGRKAAAAMDAQLKSVAEAGLGLMDGLARNPKATALDFFDVRSGLGTLILLAANNPRLTELVGNLGMQATTHIRVFGSAEHRQRNAEGWRRLYDAVFARDDEAAARAARRLVFDSRDELLRQMQEVAADK